MSRRAPQARRRVYFRRPMVESCDVSPVDACTRTPWPIAVSLEHELSGQLSPKHPALDALVSSTDELYLALQELPKYSTDFDDILIPLLDFVRRSSAGSLSAHQQAHRVFDKACAVVEVFAAALSDPRATSSHHTLLRPIKELIVFPGDNMCGTKHAFLAKLRGEYFPRAPAG